jgi:PHD/YefM family antitoxin component YafN of YafNO toxin-antitoxin module
MQTMTANAAKTNFGLFLDTAAREPVQVKRHDRVVGVMVPARDYEAMRAFYAERLINQLEQSRATATAAGMTDAILAELLADES